MKLSPIAPSPKLGTKFNFNKGMKALPKVRLPKLKLVGHNK